MFFLVPLVVSALTAVHARSYADFPIDFFPPNPNANWSTAEYQAYLGHPGNLSYPSNWGRKRDADCDGLGSAINEFCGDVCPCGLNPSDSTQMYCVTGRCQAEPGPSLTSCTVATEATDCPAGQSCGWDHDPNLDTSSTPDDQKAKTVCGGKWAGCSQQSDCTGQYVCVDGEYDSLLKGQDDHPNCDGADAGQALICVYGESDANTFCQQNDRLWNLGCGESRRNSEISGVCNGMFVQGCTMATPEAYTDLDTECFWGYCIDRSDGPVPGPYCTWKPGPCDTNDDCDNGLLCAPNGYCGGPGASCYDNNYCSDPYPCQDQGNGESMCMDVDAATGGTSPAVAYTANSGVSTICHTDSDCGSVAYCGGVRSGSTEPGVCGGEGASCSLDSSCATGTCLENNECNEWQDATQDENDPCDFSTQCTGDLVCADDGTGTSTCRQASTLRARVCQPGISDTCSSDPTYSQCGTPAPGSDEAGVCGGGGTYCSTDSDCWTQSCNSGLCEWGASAPQATTNINRRRFNDAMCPRGKTLCPVGLNSRAGGQLSMSGYECIDTSSTIDSCGGCMFGSQSIGRDCTDIDNVSDVSCLKGSCRINACVSGYAPSLNGTSCVPSTEQRRSRRWW